MGRQIPVSLKTHLQGQCTTTCLLLQVTPRQPGYPEYGVTDLDRDVTYDGLTYTAAVGFQPSMVETKADLTADNAEATSLMPEFDVPISEADIRAGVYDFAEFSLKLVNYEDLSQGHVTLQEGTLGRVTIDADGLSFVNELRGRTAELKQSVCAKDSLTCRATFGSQPAGSLIPGPIERFPCGVDATALLISGTVTAVGAEGNLTFTVGSFALAANALAPGMAFWTSGDNAGRGYEIETNTAGGQITLAHETMWPIQIGDTLQYRVDCNKQARDESKGCKSPNRHGANWPLHFRGEPDIPIGDAGSMETPGASSAPGAGGATYQPLETHAE